MSRNGMCSKRLTRLTPILEKHISNKALSGVVTLLERHGEIVDSQALGYLDRERALPMRPDAIFRIFSI